MVDSNTGEVIVVSEGENEGDASYDLAFIAPDWDKTVDKMIDAYPKEFRREGYTKTVTDYQELSEEHAKRQQEKANTIKKTSSRPNESNRTPTSEFQEPSNE